MVERMLSMHEALGSIPSFSTYFFILVRSPVRYVAITRVLVGQDSFGRPIWSSFIRPFRATSASVAQWIRRLPTEQAIQGSNPCGG